MKSIVILYDDNSKYKNEKVFDGKSANELCSEQFNKLGKDIYSINKVNL